MGRARQWREFLADFNRLLFFDLPSPPFPDPEATRWRSVWFC